MFDFLKKKSQSIIAINSRDDESEDSKHNIKTATGYATMQSARVSTQAAAEKFAKPEKYNRKILDDGTAKRNVKADAFKSGGDVRDPYTGDVLTLTKAEARMRYGDDWTKHLAEADHKISLEARHEQTKNNPWLSNEDVKASSNSADNLEVVSRKFNNAKRSRSNKDFVSDDEYLKKTGVEISDQGKQNAIESEKKAQRALNKQDFKASSRNIVKTGHKAGVTAAQNASATAATMSGIMNIIAVINGEKSAEEALVDTAVDTGKAATTAYFMGGGLTTISHSLSNSSSQFIQGLVKSNLPGQVITAVMVTGDTLKRYGNGEISTQQCILELGEKGLNMATTGYAMAMGQTLIPIPVVGAAVGALVGSMATSKCYQALIADLNRKELEHQERLRIMEECKQMAAEAKAYREELERYLEAYFKDYRSCFDSALSEMQLAFQSGDANGIIAGANQITQKLGGNVYYESVDEFRIFLENDLVDTI